jgi:hypothetical protein
MPTTNNYENNRVTTSAQLNDILLSRNFEVDILDASGKRVTDPVDAEVLSFDYQTENRNYGTVVILLQDENALEVFYGDNLGRGMEREDKNTWYDFLYQLRMFAKRNMLTFELKNMSKLKYTMQGMAALKEGLFEGYTGNKKTSYSPGPQKTKLIIKHSKQLEETDPRYRYIECIFIENEAGERFKLPFKKLAGGRAMARHVSEGGTPYDPFGQHICSMVGQINKLGTFTRKLGRREFAAENQEFVESTHEHYNTMRKQLKTIGSKRGYTAYKESWSPDKITESDLYIESIDDQLNETSIPRKQNMKEIRQFEQWAIRITEGTWATPDTPAQQEELKTLFANPVPLGPDAINATESLYNLLGDDELFSAFEQRAAQNPDDDARPIIYEWLKEKSNENPTYSRIVNDLQLSMKMSTNPKEVDEARTPYSAFGTPPKTRKSAHQKEVEKKSKEYWNSQPDYDPKDDMVGNARRIKDEVEEARNEYDANRHLAMNQKLPKKQFSDFAEWRKFISAFEPAARFVKKQAGNGYIILATDADRTLGSFNPALKFGFIGESKAMNESVMSEIDLAIETGFEDGLSPEKIAFMISQQYRTPQTAARQLVSDWLQANPMPEKGKVMESFKSLLSKML